MKKHYKKPSFDLSTFADIALMDDPFTDSDGDTKEYEDDLDDEENE